MPVAIDVGSNTVRLLKADVQQGMLTPLLYQRIITRLGEQFDKNKGLSPIAMERTLVALERFLDTLERCNAGGIRLAGTEVIRKALNRDEFIHQIRQRTGLNLEILSGTQEAEISTLGVLAVLESVPDYSLVFDVGGGSTELSLLSGTDILWSSSVPLGVVRLIDRSGSVKQRAQLIHCQLRNMLKELTDEGLAPLALAKDTRLIGTAGTVTTLAAIEQGMSVYQGEQINNSRLTTLQLERLYTRLSGLTLNQRSLVPGLEAGREDLILPGIEVVQSILGLFKKDSLLVSDFGLLEGLILQSKQA